jgi:hypothetical protein
MKQQQVQEQVQVQKFFTEFIEVQFHVQVQKQVLISRR